MKIENDELIRAKLIKESKTSLNPRKLQVEYFSLIMLAVMLISLLISAIIYQQQLKLERAIAVSRMNAELSSMKDLITFNLEEALNDLRFASLLLSYEQKLHYPKSVMRESLVKFVESKPAYNQVRYITNEGMEVIRIENNKGKIRVVADDDLKDKSKRPYFIHSMRLPYGNIYISPLDYNFEPLRLQTQLKPVIRLATKIKGSNEVPSGILILNYLGQHMLDNAQRIIANARSKGTTLAFINSSGTYLRSCRYNCSTGEFDYQNVTNQSFSYKHPKVWEIIREKKDGFFTTSEGVWSYSAIDPEFRKQSFFPQNGLGLTANPDNNIYIVLFHESSVTRESVITVFRKIALFGIPTLIIIAIISWLYSSTLAQKKILQQQIEKAAITDPLTGVSNRRFGLILLSHEFSQLQRRKDDAVLSLFFIDINFLKAVNDNFGHTSGDEMIVTVASELKNGLRSYDIISRTGGDEFMVALPNTNLENGQLVMERIRSRVFEQNRQKYPPFGIDFAYGGVDYDQKKHKTEKDLIEEADAEMYKDKARRKQGRTDTIKP